MIDGLILHLSVIGMPAYEGDYGSMCKRNLCEATNPCLQHNLFACTILVRNVSTVLVQVLGSQ